MAGIFTVYYILIASFLDALVTDVGIRFGDIEEGNPMIATIYHTNITFFYLVKLALPILLVILYRTGKLKNKWVQRGIVLLSFIYTVLLLYHITWITFILVHG